VLYIYGFSEVYEGYDVWTIKDEDLLVRPALNDDLKRMPEVLESFFFTSSTHTDHLAEFMTETLLLVASSLK